MTRLFFALDYALRVIHGREVNGNVAKREAPTDIESLHRRVRSLEVTCSILGISSIILALGCIRLTLTVWKIVKVLRLIA